MIGRRLVLGGLMSMIGGLPPPRPDQQYNPPAPPGPVGGAAGNLRARTVLVFGPSGALVGVFVYAPGTVPAPGNPPTEWMTESASDPFGNTLPSTGTAIGVGSRHNGSAAVLSGGSFATFTGPAAGAGPWTQRFVMSSTPASTALSGLTTGQGIQIAPGSGSTVLIGNGLSIGQGAGVQTLVNGSTINTAGITMQPVTAAGAVTGIIMQAGTFDGQVMDLPSEAGAGATITFAAAGVSHVAAGVGAIINPGRLATFRWVAATSLWYIGGG